MKNRQLFSEYMSLFSELFDKEITPVLSKAYWEIFKPYSDEQMTAAFKRTGQECRFFPKPADILGFIKEPDKAAPKLAWAALVDGLEKNDPTFEDPVTYSVIKALGGWNYLTTLSYRNLDFTQGKFYELYDAMCHKKQHPKLLPDGCGRQSALQINSDPERISGREALKIISGGKA